MTINSIVVGEGLEDMLRHFEEKGQTVVMASIDGKKAHYHNNFHVCLWLSE